MACSVPAPYIAQIPPKFSKLVKEAFMEALQIKKTFDIEFKNKNIVAI